MAEFVLNRRSRFVGEVLHTAWDMENSQETLQKKNKFRSQLLYGSLDQECVPDCHGQWVTCAKEVFDPQQYFIVQRRTVCWRFVRERERKSVNKTIFIIIIITIIIIIIIIIIIVVKSITQLLGLAKSIL